MKLEFPHSPPKPFAGLRASEIGVALACRLLAALLILSVVVFVLRAATPLVISDAWFFVYTLIRPWQNGHLTLADFFIKRGPSDHMNPLYRLIMLAHTEWFHMDFTVEALVGLLFAVACVYLWYRLVRKALARVPRTAITTQLIGLALVAAVFSLNARGVYDWPLVTLAFLGLFAVSVLLAAVLPLLKAGRYGLLALAAFVVFLVDDTYGILAVAAAVALLALLRLRRQLDPRAWWMGSVVLLIIAVAYVSAGRAFVPYAGQGDGSAGFGTLISLLTAHWRESWKIIAIPAWSVIITPGRIAQTFGSPHWLAVSIPVLAGAVVCAGHVWFWRNWKRRSPNALLFAAAGLMVFFYLTLGAFLVARLPRFGFDYLYQPRYMQIYDLQIVAMLMMSAQVLADTSDRRIHERLQLAATVVLVGLAGFYAHLAFGQIRSIRALQVRIASQIEWLASDPKLPPRDCLANYVTPCSNWSLDGRIAVLETLKRGPYNVFSPDFRRWHRHQVPAVWNPPDPSHQ